jgi:hypothetical protein
MSVLRDELMRGREKVIEHYPLLLARSTSKGERQLYRGRIEREQCLLDEFRAGRRASPPSGWRSAAIPFMEDSDGLESSRGKLEGNEGQG